MRLTSFTRNATAELDSYNMSSFNEAFIRGFKATPAFKVWDKTTDAAIFDLVEPK